jgi:hypothetical protein
MGAHVCGMAGMTAKSTKGQPSKKNRMAYDSEKSYLEKSESSMGLFDEYVSLLKWFYQKQTN